ncbi:MAG TPA: 2-oxoglutarate and iron-dependent oxygenase domain-containing protein [Caulobacteraceae bacterium]|nr:2-oxoglutarate and iron-dependent oxygenase domain-containing protein [Caulobacteraceae bacterium]
MSEIPVIDIAGLKSPVLADRQAVGAALGRACREIGFFYATGHGIAPDQLNQVFAASRRFFAQPAAAKHALSIKRSSNDVGFIDLDDEQLDPDAPADHKEAFNIGRELAADHPDIVHGKPFRGLNFWPDLPGWRERMLDYYDRCWAAGRLIHRGFCLDLGLDEDFFEDKLDDPIGILRLLHYPPRGEAARPTLGAGAHCDYGNITLLATDGVDGLQVRRRGGGWIDAPTIDGALICNIGDCLMRWTGDLYVSTPHRVLQPAAHRYSLAFFLDPNPDARVETLPGMAAKYPSVTGAEYLKAKLDQTYQHRTETV